jgi:acyl phosphate:glycerol-3-phosphate acyltransferase
MTFEQAVVFLILPLVGYLAGSIPFGFVIGKLHGVDIRTQGSKNIGATNLGRILGKKYFWQAFFLDSAKGFFPVLIAAMLAHRGYYVELGPDLKPIHSHNLHGVFALGHYPLPMWAPLLTGAACVLGHLFPVWLKFKGGKGVATGFGVVLGFWPVYTLAGLIGGAFFVIMVLAYRYISLASMTSAVVFVAAVVWLGRWRHTWPTYLEWNDLGPLVGAAAALAVLIIIRHRANIGRLLKGTEPKVGRREMEKARMPGNEP